VERFQAYLFVVLIGIRNATEMKNALTMDYVIYELLVQLMSFIISEFLIDWLKHAFFTKFNIIDPSIYTSISYVFCQQLLRRKPLVLFFFFDFYLFFLKKNIKIIMII